MHKSQLKHPVTQYSCYKFNIYCFIQDSIFNELVGKIAKGFPGATLYIEKIEDGEEDMAFVEAKHDADLKMARQTIANDIYAMIDEAIYKKKFEEKAKQTI